MLPRVWCSAVPDDGYPPENLISPDTTKHSMGFMTYPVEKPPVDLIFDLCCPIQLCQLTLWTRIGSLKTTGIEVFIQSTPQSDYIKIAACYDLREDILLIKTATRCSVGAETFSTPSTTTTSLNRQTNFYRTLHSRTAVCRLKLSIKTTERYTTPVLKRIELFGRPHFLANSKDIQRSIWKQWNERNIGAPQLAPSPESSSSTTKIATSAGLTIPEEFLDAITYEIMSMPMILPSGKIIDKSSLDRHGRMEETWGRSPSDPFTGVPFNVERKPILNAALKVQIDRFLLANANHCETKEMPRTVGTADLSRKRQLTQYISGGSMELKRQCVVATKVSSSSTEQFAVNSTVNRIDQAVEMALRNITRFSRQTSTSVVNENKCHKCESADGLYQIRVCSHFVCRQCLLVGSTNVIGNCLQCSCGSGFTRSDVERFYIKNII